MSQTPTQPSKPLPEASQPQECPYWAVKDDCGDILVDYICADKKRLIEIFCDRRSWRSWYQQGHSLVRVAIVEEPKE